MLKQIAIAGVIGAAVGAGVTKAYFPSTKIETVEVEKTKEKIVTVTKERKNVDGSSVIETTKTEDRKISETTKTVATIAPPAPDWRISGGSDFKAYYRLEVQRRIVGPVHLGAFADTNKAVGLSLGVEF